MVELETHFHEYEIRVKLFKQKNTFKISFLHICNTIATTSSSTGISINHFSMKVMTKTRMPRFLKYLGLYHS